MEEQQNKPEPEQAAEGEHVKPAKLNRLKGLLFASVTLIIGVIILLFGISQTFLEANKWFITLYLTLFLILTVFAYLRGINQLTHLLNWDFSALKTRASKAEKWLMSSSLIALIVLNIATDWISSAVYGYIYPATDQILIENTETILANLEDVGELQSEAGAKLDQLLVSSGFDPRDLNQYLKKLPITAGKTSCEGEIEKWYQARTIDLNAREALRGFVVVFFEKDDALTSEITSLRAIGNNEVATMLQTIQKYLNAGDAIGIKYNYLTWKANNPAGNLQILKESLKAAQALFDYDVIKTLYQELVTEEPTHTNFFAYAYFLQELNYNNEAVIYYTEAILLDMKPFRRFFTLQKLI